MGKAKAAGVQVTDAEVRAVISKAEKTGVDVWVTDASGGSRGTGRLRIRARPSGQAIFYFRYTDTAGKQDQLQIGQYGDGGDRLTLKAARLKKDKLSLRYQDGERDLRSIIDHERAEESAAREVAKRQREEEERRAKSGTLSGLLDGYVSMLEHQGKEAAGAAKNIFKLHVKEAFPAIAALPAADVRREDVSKLLAKLIEDGKGRSAGKLRAYMRAAFAAALDAPVNPDIPSGLRDFALIGNPAANIAAKTFRKYNRERDRHLSETELRAYLKRVSALAETMTRDALKLALLLGGQRPAQLVRIRPEDVDMDAKTVTLYDPKGARDQPRKHVLPLTTLAAEIIERLETVRTVEYEDESPYLLTSDGESHIQIETLSNAVHGISKKMVENKEARAPFQMRDIRRTCETMLAAMGISRDVRAQLLSHGIGGVQDKHYDRHAYTDEKRNALTAWAAKIEAWEKDEEAPSNVTSIGEARAA
jgi:integrase